MGLTGLISGVAHYSIIKAFSSAPASVITPFGYTNLIWATLFGYIVFSEFPDPFTFIGAGIIILSGLYILRSERKADA
jgi:drug/metabolite transporter (DMT)-like permease